MYKRARCPLVPKLSPPRHPVRCPAGGVVFGGGHVVHPGQMHWRMASVPWLLASARPERGNDIGGWSLSLCKADGRKGALRTEVPPPCIRVACLLVVEAACTFVLGRKTGSAALTGRPVPGVTRNRLVPVTRTLTRGPPNGHTGLP